MSDPLQELTLMSLYKCFVSNTVDRKLELSTKPGTAVDRNLCPEQCLQNIEGTAQAEESRRKIGCDG